MSAIHHTADGPHYRCGSCAALFAQTEAHTRTWLDPDEARGEREYFTRIEYRCNRCGSDDLHGIVLCRTCGEVEAAQGADDCDTCIDKAEAAWDERMRAIRAAKIAKVEALHDFIADVMRGAA